MKKISEITSILISVIMLIQFMAVSVSAQALEAYWGQDFENEDWYTIDYKLESGSDDTENPTEAPAELDRTVVSESYYDAAKVVYDLGVMPDVYTNHAMTVTRGDMAVVLTQIMGITDLAEGNKDTEKFTDVEVGTELNGCVNAVNMMGYIPGVTSTTFEPDTEMVFQDIVKVLVTVLGYEPVASNYGGYPSGYLAVASSKDISKGVSISGTASITYEQLAQLIYNSLNTGLMKQTGWGMSGSTYAETQDTLLYKGLGLEKVIGTVGFSDNSTAQVNGFEYKTDYVGGHKAENKEFAIKDAEILDYESDFMILYTDGENILSGLEYSGYAVLINNGEADVTTRVVPVEVIASSYTKFRCSTTEEYRSISETGYYLLPDVYNGSKTIRVYLSNEDETATTSKSYKINFVNKHTATFMVNGEVYKTVTAGYGNGITKPSTPNVAGYTFDGWINCPTAMPDRDITIYAKLIPNVTYTGKTTSGGQPVQASIYVNGSHTAYGNYNTGEFSFEAPIGANHIWLRVGNIQKVINVNSTEKSVDLGTIEMPLISEQVVPYPSNYVGVEFAEAVISDEYREYVQVEGNSLTVTMGFGSSYSENIKAAIAGEYSDYTKLSEAAFTMNVQKSGAESQYITIDETETNFEVSILVDEMDEYIVLRDNGAGVDVLTATPNENGEYIEASGDVVKIFAKKLATYSVIGKSAPVEEVEMYKAETVWNELDTITVNVTKPEEENEAAVLYTALYDENGVLVKVYIKDEFEETNSFKSDYRASVVSAFVWDNMTSLTN